ncbi:MAG: hypothetical protein ABIV27_04630 [Gemmatimonadales bacterium]
MRKVILIFALLLGAACQSTSTGVEGGVLAKGRWGGNDAGVIITDSVTHVHIGCTYGDFPAAVPVDERGRFRVSGSYLRRAYPVAMGPLLPAEFTGTINGSSMTYTVVVTDTVENEVVTLGPTTVTLGKEPRMGPCPICHTPRVRSAI